MAAVLALQSGGALLLESGAPMLLESGTAPAGVANVTLRQDHPANSYYDIGDIVEYTATFTTLDGDPIDPDVVVFSLKVPAGTVTSYTFGSDADVVQASAGVYVLTSPELAASGVHWCRVDGTGPYAAAERPVGVRSSRFSS